MHDNLILLIVVVIAAFAIGIWASVWIILNRFIKLGYYIADIWKSKQPASYIVHANTPLGASDKPKPKVEVEELPIDVLAPRLKDPPRSPGGFGSKVPEDT